jgi:transcriptional regulator with XRE-family HTH domain
MEPDVPDQYLSDIHHTAATYQGRVIATARKDAGFTQRQAAEALGVNPRTWKSWEQGQRLASPEVRRKIAATFMVDPKRLGLEPWAACPCCGSKLG